MTAGAPILAARGLAKRFGGVQALDEVSFELLGRQIAGLIGPNGAGKTTLFNLVTGLDRPDAGATFFHGQDITHTPAHAISRLGLARTFQNVRLPGQLTVLDNVRVAFHARAGYGFLQAALHLGRYRRRERQISAAATALLEMFDLHGLGDQLAASLPYGMRRNLEIARALATGPSLLLLDEPAAGLNGRETADLAALIRRIRDEFALTVLLIEHDMKIVMNLCERVLVLHYGKLIASGPPGQIKRDPQVIEAYLGPFREPA
ncbi:MAG: ABC transporter ATP-binding protein [Planctomycetota bacterium]|nr:ABC transporter ATP-binding protein [Planctomycetota bacterium]